MDTPVKSSAADRRGPARWDALVVLCVLFLAGASAFFAVRGTGGAAGRAVVTKEGERILSVNLERNQTGLFPLEDLPYPMTLEVKDGAVRVLESACPGGDCAHAGWISEPGRQIICLPNRVIVRLEGASADPFDAISG